MDPKLLPSVALGRLCQDRRRQGGNGRSPTFHSLLVSISFNQRRLDELTMPSTVCRGGYKDALPSSAVGLSEVRPSAVPASVCKDAIFTSKFQSTKLMYISNSKKPCCCKERRRVDVTSLETQPGRIRADTIELARWQHPLFCSFWRHMSPRWSAAIVR